jgi:hypothetical protein
MRVEISTLTSFVLLVPFVSLVPLVSNCFLWLRARLSDNAHKLARPFSNQLALTFTNRFQIN